MKILDTGVIDPREGGEYQDPYICIKVDEPVDETNDPHVHKTGRWRVVPCGPFVAVEYSRSAPDWELTEDLGTFNTLGFHREQLIAVTVYEPSGEKLSLHMGVARVKRLLRKHDPEWRVLPSDYAALNGKIVWRVERAKPECMSCGLAPVQTVWYSGAHVPLCAAHLESHAKRIKSERFSRSH